MERSKFSSKIGFVLAAAGSAVGLGNLWRFPYLAARYGGGAFLLCYLIFMLTFGFAIMITEISIGRKTGQSPINAYKKLNKKSTFIGWLGFIVPLIIYPYYSVIGGWVSKYFTMYITGNHAKLADPEFFGSYISQTWEPILWLFIFVAVTSVVLFFGVKNGIEKVSKFLMPILIVLCVIVSIYSLTLPGAMEGVKYFLVPNFKDFSISTVLAALGQMFYSLSLAMGIMITYGSYLKKEDDIEKSVKQIEIFDTGVAILAGFMVIPAVFAFSGGNTNIDQGPGLMFKTLPQVFEKMGMTSVIGAVFFLLVIFAALTSTISIMEAIVSTVVDKFKLNRKLAVILVGLVVFLIGCLPSLGYGVLSNVKLIGGMDILDSMDFITNSVLMPLGALLTAIFVGFILKPETIIEEVESSGKFKQKTMYVIIIKYVAPVCLALILITSILGNLGIVPAFKF